MNYTVVFVKGGKSQTVFNVSGFPQLGTRVNFTPVDTLIVGKVTDIEYVRLNEVIITIT